jgi:AcrR family transcriptional regulator/DNA-binding MarR family transcriptional regulator
VLAVSGIPRERVVERGRALVARDRIADIQRARIISAAVQVACEHGAGRLTVAHVVARAGVSRRTFYEVFRDSEECLLASLEQALVCASERVSPAYRASERWRERMRAGLGALLELFDEDPLLARLLVVESSSAGRSVLELRSSVIGLLIDAVDEGRTEARSTAGIARLTAEGVVGGVLSVLRARIEGHQLMDEGSEPLVGLLRALMSMIVLPYLGAGAARRELERQLPARHPGYTHPVTESGGRLLSDPFKDAGMRLTYRTMRVLSAIASNPGSSNKQVGTIAEVSDQGQVSKLLARLQHLGLILNDGGPHSRGLPNAWQLTATGRQVERSVHSGRTETITRQGESQ